MADDWLFIPVLISLHATFFACTANGYTFEECMVQDQEGQTKFLCNQKNLKRVPSNLPLSLTDIDISHNSIKIIKSGDFFNLKEVKTLNVSNNVIYSVQNGAFRYLISLTELNLSGNRLSRLQNGMFHGMHNLTVLLLERNQISTIENLTFSGFHQLLCVKLFRNKLSNIKKLQAVFRVATLKEVHVGFNNISVFQSSDISDLPLALQVLNLTQNPLDVFKISTNVLPNLEEIDVSQCFTETLLKWDVQNKAFLQNVTSLYMVGVQITLENISAILQTFDKSLLHLTLSAVPSTIIFSSICQISTLTDLTVIHSNFKRLNGTALLNCTRLKALDLRRNRLFRFEGDFVSLKSLTSLDLAYNEFKNIPSVINKLPLLESLNMAFNQIEEIPYSSFTNLSNLTHLYLFGNRISKIDANAFQTLSNLKVLILRSNLIRLIKGTFKFGPVNLEILDIGFNSLVSLRPNDLSGLSSLRSLYLNSNKIKTIHEKAFRALASLRELHLQMNQITDDALQPDIFSGPTNLYGLYLQKNHLLRRTRLKKDPFIYLKSLRVLSVYFQSSFEIDLLLPSNMLRNLTMLSSFWAQELGLKSLPPDLFRDNRQLHEISLSGNDLSNISPDLFLPLENLSKLYLKDTRLKSLDFVIQAKLNTLSYLQISNNHITSINDTVINSLPGLRVLDMQGNTFTCDCSNAWLIEWINNDNVTQVLRANIFECNSPLHLKSTKLMKTNMQACSVNIELICYIFSASLVLLTSTVPLIYHLLHWQIVYAYYLLLAFLYDKKKGAGKSKSFMYDAFISYNTHDEPWVINELVPKLEGEQGWRLCLHHRDFQPGKPIVDNIVDGIYGSRKTICIVSQHYLESEWCSREVQVASFRLFDEKKDVLILVFLEDIPVYQLSPYYKLRSLVKKQTFLSWPKVGQDTHVFWEKLRLALKCEKSGE